MTHLILPHVDLFNYQIDLLEAEQIKLVNNDLITPFFFSIVT